MFLLSFFYVGLAFYEPINKDDSRNISKKSKIGIFAAEAFILSLWILDLLFQLTIVYQEQRFHFYLYRKMKRKDKDRKIKVDPSPNSGVRDVPRTASPDKQLSRNSRDNRPESPFIEKRKNLKERLKKLKKKKIDKKIEQNEVGEFIDKKNNIEKVEDDSEENEAVITAKKYSTKLFILTSVLINNFLIFYKSSILCFFLVEFIFYYTKIVGDIERFTRVFRTSNLSVLFSNVLCISYSNSKSFSSTYKLASNDF